MGDYLMSIKVSNGSYLAPSVVSKVTENSVRQKFYCLHNLVDCNYCIQVKKKMLEFSTVLLTLSPYHNGLRISQYNCLQFLSPSFV